MPVGGRQALMSETMASRNPLSGDCGVAKYHKLHEIPFTYSREEKSYSFVLPTGATTAFLNISQVFSQFEEVGLEDPREHESVRSVSISDANKVLTVIFHPDAGRAFLNATLQAKTNGSIVEHQVCLVDPSHTRWTLGNK